MEQTANARGLAARLAEILEAEPRSLPAIPVDRELLELLRSRLAALLAAYDRALEDPRAVMPTTLQASLEAFRMGSARPLPATPAPRSRCSSWHELDVYALRRTAELEQAIPAQMIGAWIWKTPEEPRDRFALAVEATELSAAHLRELAELLEDLEARRPA